MEKLPSKLGLSKLNRKHVGGCNLNSMEHIRLHVHVTRCYKVLYVAVSEIKGPFMGSLHHGIWFVGVCIGVFMETPC